MDFINVPAPIWILAGALLTTGASACESSPAAPSPAERIAARPVVAFGDSLTSGHGIGQARAYPALLESRLREEGMPFRVVNAGVSGDTTAGALRRLPAVLALQPSIVVVALGANDGLRGVPVAEVERNLGRIVGELRASGARVLLCGMEALPVHGWQYSIHFHNAFVSLSREHDVAVVPFFMASVIGRRDLLLPDLVHPNAAGAAVIADAIWPQLAELARQALAS